MKKALYFVLSDLFVPLFLGLGAQVEAETTMAPLYLTFLPRERVWLGRNTDAVFPNDVYTLDDVPVRTDLVSPAEAADLLAFMRAKHGGGEAEWMTRLHRVASYSDALMTRQEIGVIVMWNGMDFVGRVLTLLARRAGVPTLFLENGYFSRTLQADTQGVNSSSSLMGKRFPQIEAELAQVSGRARTPRVPSMQPPLRMLDRGDLALGSARRLFDGRYYSRFPEQRGTSWFRKKRLERARRRIPVDAVELPPDFVFVPLQVHDDTQVLLNCRHFNTVERFFEVAYAAIKKNMGPDTKIVVKEHPEDLCRYSYDEFRRRFPDVIWLKKYDVEKLLDRAASVVVINSSVGLQAVKRRKPTIVFGESFYTRDEVAFCVRSLDDTDAVFARARAGIDAGMARTIQVFLDYLDAVYFFPGSWKAVDGEGLAGATARVVVAAQGLPA